MIGEDVHGCQLAPSNKAKDLHSLALFDLEEGILKLRHDL